MYKTILLDLDGTLTDPALGITNSIIYALKRWNIEVPDRQSLYKFIGPPLVETFGVHFGFSKEDTQRAVEVYREYFKDKGIFENRPYDGVKELLRELKSRKKTLILATSKPEIYAKKILEHFELDGYFDFVAGAAMDYGRSKKAEVIAYALENAGVTDTQSAVMIGDREQDVIGAAANGLDSIGVLYGYGSRAELEAAGATHIAEKMTDILSLI